MDIRTKLVFTLVSVALGSMLVLSLTMFRTADEALTRSRKDLLEAVAESKKDGLQQVFEGWIDRVRLVASRTQLRVSLREYNRTGSEAARARIARILSDAVEAVEVIEGLTVFDPRHAFVTGAGGDVEEETEDPTVGVTPVAEGIGYRGISPNGEGILRVGFIAQLALDGENLGDVHVRLNAGPLLELAEDRPRVGAGESGEVVIVANDEDGVPRALRRNRPGGPGSWEPIQPRDEEDPLLKALRGEDGLYEENGAGEEERAVWAAVRSLPEVGMGMVVKLDEEEARGPLVAFRAENTRMVLSLGAFAIVLGTLLGFRFTRPIKELAQVADRIREGTLSARAAESGEDEVALLSRTFNDMADEMEQQLSLLREFQRYFELSLDMLCIAAPDGYFKRVNPAFERTLGWTTQELLEVSFLEFVHPDDLKKTEEEIEHLAMGFPTISFENRYRTRRGGYRHLTWTAHPDERSGLIYAIARDITAQDEARKKTADEIRSLRRRLREAEAKGTEGS